MYRTTRTSNSDQVDASGRANKEGSSRSKYAPYSTSRPPRQNDLNAYSSAASTSVIQDQSDYTMTTTMGESLSNNKIKMKMYATDAIELSEQKSQNGTIHVLCVITFKDKSGFEFCNIKIPKYGLKMENRKIEIWIEGINGVLEYETLRELYDTNVSKVKNVLGPILMLIDHNQNNDLHITDNNKVFSWKSGMKEDIKFRKNLLPEEVIFVLPLKYHPIMKDAIESLASSGRQLPNFPSDEEDVLRYEVEAYGKTFQIVSSPKFMYMRDMDNPNAFYKKSDDLRDLRRVLNKINR
eukprot:GHVP01048170.1.p1 GENE.GHVP01048170.1~~GHVP01048170.1.p1  ORF type:complete len:334 (-),score=41.78 GHVP01048170.1:102-986(-)